MSLRAKIFIVVSIIILLILGISIGLLIRSKKQAASSAVETPPVTAPLGSTEAGPSANSIPLSNQLPTVSAPRPPNPVEVEQQGVANLARVFMERYNTYSSDNNWQNIKEVEHLVTPELWKRLRARIGSGRSATFMGVTTQVLSVRLGAWQEAAATVIVQALRLTDTNGQQTREQQTGTVAFVKSGGTWLVESFTWEK